MQTVKRYETIIYLNGDAYDEWEALMYPEREGVSLGFARGHEAALAHLMQWEYGESTEEYSDPPWGSADQTYAVDGYVMSWHTGLGYASLTRVTEVGPDDE